MEARVTLTKETKEKLKQPMGRLRKNELRWQKLEEADSNGKLQRAKNRADVANIIGITNYNNGYAYVTRLIQKKSLIETIVDFNGRRAVYEYSLGTKPEHGYVVRTKLAKLDKVQSKPAIMKEPLPQVEPKTEAGMVVTITQKDMVIKVENIKVDDLIKLIK
jgi:hypothetical protein